MAGKGASKFKMPGHELVCKIKSYRYSGSIHYKDAISGDASFVLELPGAGLR